MPTDPLEIPTEAGPSPSAPFEPVRGKERWPVKTLNDPDHDKIDPSARVATVPDLWKQQRPQDMPLTFPMPQYQSSRAEGPETTIWQVEGRIIAHKWEMDGDFHIVLQDLDTGHTMIVESPQNDDDAEGQPFVGDMCPADLKDRIVKARARLRERLNPSPRFGNARIRARITGVGFFDIFHGQTGVAKHMTKSNPGFSSLFEHKKTCHFYGYVLSTNAIEIHPILDVEFLD